MFFFTLNYQDFFFPNTEGNWKKKIFPPIFERKAIAQNTRTQSQINLNTLGVPCGKCQRGELVYLLWNVPIQIFFHNYKMNSAIENDGTQLQNNNFRTF